MLVSSEQRITQMDSLTDLKKFLLDNEVPIKAFHGFELIVGKDKWGMSHGVLYCNGEAVNHKDKKFFAEYIKRKKNVRHQSTQTRKWRGISSRNRGERRKLSNRKKSSRNRSTAIKNK
jgi:hypothetical protein